MKTRSLAAAALVVAAAALVAGCSASAAPVPQPSSSSALVGRWSVQIGHDDDAPVPAPATVELDADGTYTATGLEFPQLDDSHAGAHTWSYETERGLVLENGQFGEQLAIEPDRDSWKLCEVTTGTCADADDAGN